jgi:hypothetical protein
VAVSVYPSTRAQARTDALLIADAYGSQRWDATPGGEVDRRLGMVHAKEWKLILNANRYYNFSMLTPTTDVNGVIPFSSLTTGTGDATQNFYRVVKVMVGNCDYQFVQGPEYLQVPNTALPAFVWLQSGNTMIIPNALSTTVTGVWVNWYPQRFDLLASDASIVVLPIDYDDVFAYAAAARLLSKGGAETGAAAELSAIADGMRQDILADIARVSTDPATVRYADSPWDWGG